MARTKKAPAMPLYGKDAWNDEAFTALPWDAQGLFWRLAYWQWTEGSIPADVDRIVEMVGKPRTSRRLLTDFLLKQSFFVNHPEKPGRLYNKTTNEHLQAMLLERDRKSIGAEITNAKRTAKRTGEVRLASGIPYATRDASATAIAVSLCKSEEEKQLTPQQEAVKRVVDALEDHTTGFLLPTGGLVARWLRDYTIDVVLATIAEQGKLGNLDGRDSSYLFRCIESHARRPQSRTSGTRPLASVSTIGAGPARTHPTADEAQDIASALRLPDWPREDCTREQGAAWLNKHVREECGGDLSKAQRLTDWLREKRTA